MGNNANADDTWVADGSYLRGNLIQLGYTFTPDILQRIGLYSLRLYGNINNAFLITSSDYLGYDPENSSRLGDNKWEQTVSSLHIHVQEHTQWVLM